MLRRDADRNLLFGINALQNDFITRDALIVAMNAWALEKHRPLGDILVERNALNPDDRDLLNQLIDRHLARHGGDPAASLAAMSSIGSVADDLRREVADSDVHASLDSIAPSLAEDPYATRASFPPEPPHTGVRFSKLRKHAEGNLGVVYVARDEELHRDVALKEIKERNADHPHNQAKFLLEAEVTGGLEHPGIVPVYGLGHHMDGRPFYAMRFIRGKSLLDAIKRFHANFSLKNDPGKRLLELQKLLRRFTDVCNAIAYAHSRGVLHRDLKPANVMVGKYGETLVVDWGLAKTLGRSGDVPDAVADHDDPLPEASFQPSSADHIDVTQAGTLVGTPAYMSPEQAAGRLDLLGPASDIYGLGATLYHLLVGWTPVQGVTLGDLVANIQAGQITRPRILAPWIDPALEAICLKAMALRPDDRYGSARALADDVDRWTADEPVSAYNEPLRVRLSRWGRRHKPLVVGAVAVLVVLAASSIPLTLLYRQRTEALVNVVAARVAEKLERKRADTHLYLNSVDLANREVATASFARADKLLDQCPEELRRSEWYYLKRVCHPEVLTFRGHKRSVASVAYATDGRRIASGDDDGVILIWDAESGAVIQTLRGHSGRVKGLNFSPDGRLLASGGADATTRLWDPADGREVRILRGHEKEVSSAIFSPDGRTLATSGWDGTARIWDPAVGRELHVLRGHSGWLTRVAFSPNGKVLASASMYSNKGSLFSSQVKTWECATGAERFSCDLADHWTTDLAFTIDGTRLLASGFPHNSHVLDVTSGRELGRSPVGGLRMILAPGGREFASARGHYDHPGGRITTAGSDLGSIRDARNGRIILALQGHDGWVTDLAYQPDGRRLATASLDGTVKVWDTTERSTVVLTGQPDKLTSIQFSEDGRRVSTTGNSQFRVSDVASGQTLLASRTGTNAPAFDFASPDGHRILFHPEKNGDATIWEVDSGRELVRLRDSRDLDLFITSPDGRRIVAANGWSSKSTAAEPRLKAWDAATGTLLFDVRADEKGYLSGLKFSPDGRLLASGLDGDSKIARVWSATDGREIVTLRGHEKGVFSAAFSPDGHRLATGGRDQTARLWDLASGRELAVLRGHTSIVTDVTFSRDGARIATVGHDGVVKIWNSVEATSEPLTIGNSSKSGFAFARFDPDGSRLLMTTPGVLNESGRALDKSIGSVKLCDLASGQELLTLRGSTKDLDAAAASQDASRVALAAADFSVTIFDLSRNRTPLLQPVANPHRPLRIIGDPTRTLFGHENTVASVAYRPDGRQLASGGADRTICLWDTDDGRVTRDLVGHLAAVRGLGYSPDGRRLASVDEYGDLKLWDIADGREIWSIKAHSQCRAVSFHPDGKLLASAGTDNTIKLWDTDSGRAIRTLSGHQNWVNGVSFSHDGNRLASCGDTTVRIWEVHSGKTIHTMKGHTGIVRTVAFSPNGQLLASGGNDGLVKLWDPVNGAFVRDLIGHKKAVVGVAFRADGNRIASASEDGTAKTWNTEDGRESATYREHSGGAINGVSFSPDGRRLASASDDGTVENRPVD